VRTRRAICAVLAVVVVAGCSDDNEAAPASSTTAVTVPAVPYSLAISASVANEMVTVDGTSNLPDETQVSVRGTLAILDQFDSRESPGYPDVGGNEATVMAGKFRVTFPLDFSDITALAETARLSDETSPPIFNFDEDVAVCATASNGKTLQGEWMQPESVRKVLGDFGAALRESPGAEQLGTALPGGPAWALSAETTAPFESSAARQRIREAQSFGPIQVLPLKSFC
jgi:hypothetical protein